MLPMFLNHQKLYTQDLKCITTTNIIPKHIYYVNHILTNILYTILTYFILRF